MSKLTNKSNFTIASNAIIMDKNLSYRSKGVYLYLCSRPDGWDFFMGEIVSHSTEGIDAVRKSLKELESYGYISRTRVNGEGGKFHYDYEIFQTPTGVLPHTVLPHTVSTATVKSNTNNTDYLINTDLSSLPIGKEGNKFLERKKFIPPTIDEIKEYCQELGLKMTCEALHDHYQANGWKQKGGNSIKDWKATVRGWARREKDFAPKQSSTTLTGCYNGVGAQKGRVAAQGGSRW